MLATGGTGMYSAADECSGLGNAGQRRLGADHLGPAQDPYRRGHHLRVCVLTMEPRLS